MNKRTTLLLLLGLFFSFPVFSQFNLSAGYVYGQTDPEVTNEIITSLNQSISWLPEDEYMKTVNGLHGYHIGMRYRYEVIGITAGMTSKYALTEYRAENLSMTEFYREWYYRMNTLSAGLEFFAGRVSFGGTFDYNYLRVRSEDNYGTRSDRYTFLQSEALSSHFFLGFNLDGNDLLSIAVQPYVQIPWTNFDLTPFNDQIKDLEFPGERLEEGDGFLNYGIRLIFQNGVYKN